MSPFEGDEREGAGRVRPLSGGGGRPSWHRHLLLRPSGARAIAVAVAVERGARHPSSGAERRSPPGARPRASGPSAIWWGDGDKRRWLHRSVQVHSPVGASSQAAKQRCFTYTFPARSFFGSQRLRSYLSRLVATCMVGHDALHEVLPSMSCVTRTLHYDQPLLQWCNTSRIRSIINQRTCGTIPPSAEPQFRWVPFRDFPAENSIFP